MKLRTIIIDDEKLSLDLLRAMLTDHCPAIEIVGEATNIEDARELCKKLNPEVLFLDIQLSDGMGFDILDTFPKRSFHTVFVTAHKEYSIKALKHAAIDYILKPIGKEELLEAVRKVMHKQVQIHEERSNIDHYSSQRLILPHSSGFKMTELKNIIRLEANDNYTVIYSIGGEKSLVSKTLKEFETNIKSDWFIRVHKSHIINIQNLREYTSENGYFAIMIDGQKIPVSKTKQAEFLNRVNDFVANNSGSGI